MQGMRQWESQVAMVGERGNVTYLDLKEVSRYRGVELHPFVILLVILDLHWGIYRLFVCSILFWSTRVSSIVIIAFCIGTLCLIV